MNSQLSLIFILASSSLMLSSLCVMLLLLQFIVSIWPKSNGNISQEHGIYTIWITISSAHLLIFSTHLSSFFLARNFFTDCFPGYFDCFDLLPKSTSFLPSLWPCKGLTMTEHQPMSTTKPSYSLIESCDASDLLICLYHNF